MTHEWWCEYPVFLVNHSHPRRPRYANTDQEHLNIGGEIVNRNDWILTALILGVITLLGAVSFVVLVATS